MKIVFASNNINKIKEIQVLVPDYIQIVSLKDIGCVDDIPETSLTIEGNAILKADFVSKKYGIPCFADDTGLEIDALNGDPGVFSARYAGEPKNDQNNIDKVLRNLKSESNRNASFKTIICLNLSGLQYLFEGVVKGEITKNRVGDNGFGYDPIFRAKGMHKTFAELTMEEKSNLSHRGIAVQKLLKFLSEIK